MLKVLWFGINFALIIYFSYLHYFINKDAAVGFFYLMYIITFPLGLIVPLIFIIFSDFFNSSFFVSHLFVVDIILPGVLFMLLGYFQWFILLKKIKNYFSSYK